MKFNNFEDLGVVKEKLNKKEEYEKSLELLENKFGWKKAKKEFFKDLMISEDSYDALLKDVKLSENSKAIVKDGLENGYNGTKYDYKVLEDRKSSSGSFSLGEIEKEKYFNTIVSPEEQKIICQMATEDLEKMKSTFVSMGGDIVKGSVSGEAQLKVFLPKYKNEISEESKK